MGKRIKKLTVLPGSNNVYHIMLRYKVLDDCIKLRLKFYHDDFRLDIKAITGAIKNPGLSSIISCNKLADEFNKILYSRNEPFRIDSTTLREKLIEQGILYPF